MDLSTYFGHMDNLKKRHFSTGPPTQAGIITQDLLTTRLHQAGYRQSKVTPGYWHHEWRPISFTLVVDDFGVKYINKTNVDHLTSVLSQDYEIDTDWDGTRYLGLP